MLEAACRDDSDGRQVYRQSSGQWCLTGKPPFVDDNLLDVIRKHRKEMPARFEKFVLSSGVPAALELLVFKALQKQPDRRPQSMSDFESALQMISEGRSDELTLDGFPLESSCKNGARKDSHLQALAIAAIILFAAILPGGICLPRHVRQQTRNASMKTQALIPNDGAADEQKLEHDVGAYEHRLNSNSRALADLLERLGIKYTQHKKLGKAEQVLKQSLVIREKELGPDHREVADSLNALATLYLSQKEFSEAESLFRRSLAIKEKGVGPEHLELTRILSGLVSLFERQGKYAEAEKLLKKCLSIQKTVRGSEHPAVADSQSDLQRF